MHSLFEPQAAEEIISRLHKLQPDSRPLWGRMNVAQMMAHCQAPLKAYLEEVKWKRGLMSILFGKVAKRKLFSDKPWPKSLPTSKEFIVIDDREFQKEKIQLVDLIHRFSTEGINVTETIHPFFGKMSSQEWGLWGYRHLDHHLRQFGA